MATNKDNKQKMINIHAAFNYLDELEAYRQILENALPRLIEPYPNQPNMSRNDLIVKYHEDNKKRWNRIEYDFLAGNYLTFDYCFEFLLSNMYINYWIYVGEYTGDQYINDDDINRVCDKYNINRKDFDDYRQTIEDNLDNDKDYREYQIEKHHIIRAYTEIL